MAGLVVALVVAIWMLESNVNDSVARIKAIEARLTRLEKLEALHHGSP